MPSSTGYARNCGSTDPTVLLRRAGVPVLAALLPSLPLSASVWSLIFFYDLIHQFSISFIQAVASHLPKTQTFHWIPINKLETLGWSTKSSANQLSPPPLFPLHPARTLCPPLYLALQPKRALPHYNRWPQHGAAAHTLPPPGMPSSPLQQTPFTCHLSNDTSCLSAPSSHTVTGQPCTLSEPLRHLHACALMRPH